MRMSNIVHINRKTEIAHEKITPITGSIYMKSKEIPLEGPNRCGNGENQRIIVELGVDFPSGATPIEECHKTGEGAVVQLYNADILADYKNVHSGEWETMRYNLSWIKQQFPNFAVVVDF